MTYKKIIIKKNFNIKKEKNNSNCSYKHQLTYMFSGDMINSLRLITDLHKMIQLIKKLLTGTMHLNKNFMQSRLRNIRIYNIQYLCQNLFGSKCMYGNNLKYFYQS